LWAAEERAEFWQDELVKPTLTQSNDLNHVIVVWNSYNVSIRNHQQHSLYSFSLKYNKLAKASKNPDVSHSLLECVLNWTVPKSSFWICVFGKMSVIVILCVSQLESDMHCKWRKSCNIFFPDLSILQFSYL
jgi:hypothetical protein